MRRPKQSKAQKQYAREQRALRVGAVAARASEVVQVRREIVTPLPRRAVSVGNRRLKLTPFDAVLWDRALLAAIESGEVAWFRGHFTAQMTFWIVLASHEPVDVMTGMHVTRSRLDDDSDGAS